MELSDSRFFPASPQSVRLAVVMERRALASRWQSETWQPVAVVPDRAAGGPRVIAAEAERTQWLHPGFEVVLHRREAEGYYLNLTADRPYMFVMWRMDGARGVPLPAALASWLAAYVDANYRPEPKKRVRPPSFKGARRDE